MALNGFSVRDVRCRGDRAASSGHNFSTKRPGRIGLHRIVDAHSRAALGKKSSRSAPGAARSAGHDCYLVLPAHARSPG